MKIFQVSKLSLCSQGAHNLNDSQNPSESPAWLVKTDLKPQTCSSDAYGMKAENLYY